MKHISVSSTQIDNVLLEIRKRIQAKTGDLMQTDKALYPLDWYISTGRAPTDFPRLLVNCSSRQFTTIANRLIKAGTVEDAINSVCAYIGFRRAN